LYVFGQVELFLDHGSFESHDDECSHDHQLYRDASDQSQPEVATQTLRFLAVVGVAALAVQLAQLEAEEHDDGHQEIEHEEIKEYVIEHAQGMQVAVRLEHLLLSSTRVGVRIGN
jgi:hypothetical protein